MVAITIFPLLASVFKIQTTISAVKVSRPEVGSSQNITSGSVINSTPIDTLFHSPPEHPLMKLFPIFVFLQLVNLSSSINESTFAFTSFHDLFNFNIPANIKHSSAVKVGNSMSSYIT